MSRVLLAAFAIVAAGCAQASHDHGGNGDPDAPGTPLDAPRADAPAFDAQPAGDAPRIDAAPPIDAPPPDLCPTTTTCGAGATALTGISGDDGGETAASGYTEMWYSIRVSETDDSIFGVPMLLDTELASTSGAMFDLTVYVDESTDDIDCTTPTGSITTSGTTEDNSLEWGETGTFSNGDDDSRTVEIHIAPHAGTTCSASAPWQLTVLGGGL